MKVKKTLLIVILFLFYFFFVVYDFQKVVLGFFSSSIIYSLFILSPKALETIWPCFDFVHGRIMKWDLFPMFYATKPLKCILFVFVVLFSALRRKVRKDKKNQKPTAAIQAFSVREPRSASTYEDIVAVRPEHEAVCEPPYFNREILKSLCTFWCHFYMIGVFFFSFKLWDIDWNWVCDWIQIIYFVNVKFLSVVLVRLVQARLSAPCWTFTCKWKRLDLIFHDTEPAAPPVRPSGSWLCAFSRPATHPSPSHCHPNNTPKSCSASSALPLEGAPQSQTTQGKVVLILLKI